ncbi:MAG: hypothetical protein ACE5K0_00235 [Candidatus Methanofastidiosia archaeon]
MRDFEFDDFEKKKDEIKPDWKDYIAITIATLETIFFPFIILIVVMILLGLLVLLLF